MNNEEKLANAFQTLATWYKRADEKEKKALAEAVCGMVDNFSYCFKCADPDNAEHIKEIELIEREFIGDDNDETM